MMHVSIPLRRLFAVSGLVFSLAGFGLFASINTAAAPPKPDTGTYDEQANVAQEACWGGVASPPPKAFKIGNPESAGCAHAR